MINDLMLYAHPPEMVPLEVDAHELVLTTIREIRLNARRQGTEVVCHSDSAPYLIRADREHLIVAFEALLKNSLEAVGSGGQIDVTIDWDQGPSSRDRTLRVSVADTGSGIPDEIRSHIFDPFFSGREAGRGLGLGLSKCWRIVKLHGGRITVEGNSSGGGARFRIELPVGFSPTAKPGEDPPARTRSEDVCVRERTPQKYREC